ncbi:Gfo/Idh/MocA family oxidoreductase [Sphingomonas oryzagri]
MTTSSPIGVGLAGYGLAGSILHAPILESLPDYRIRAVMTSRTEVADRRDSPVVVPDIDALLGNPGVDLVVVVTPNALHAGYAEAALRAGKHVVIDKPMASDVAACDRLIDLAAGTDQLLSVYHNRRWDGDYLAIQALLGAGVIGTPALYEARWDRFRPSAPAAWRNAPGPGSGLLWDLGPHLIDQAIGLFGWPDAMTADIAMQRGNAQADDYFEIALHYGAMRSIVSASSLVAATRPHLALHGTKGSWWTESIDPWEAALRAGQPLTGLPDIPVFRATTDAERLPNAVPAGDAAGFYRRLAAAIRGEGPVPVDPIDARNVVALIEAAHRGEALPPRRLPDNAGQG